MKNLIDTYEYEPDNLINGTSKVNTKAVKMKKGSNYKKGTVLGIITTTGYAVPVDSTKEDGSALADCILAEDVVAVEDEVQVAYASGEFNREALVFVGKETVDAHEKELRKLGIFLKSNI